ncbi:MAG: hypothetical protein IT289_08545 [Oligoflexia bacterium]|nr:hypothetical protein [Oligoflexia bacterium]
MKKFLSVVVFGLALSSSALAARNLDRQYGPYSTDLDRCGGSAHIESRGQDAILEITGVRNCSNLSVNGREQKLEEGFGGLRSGRAYLNFRGGYNTFLVQLSSNSGSTSTAFRITGYGSGSGSSNDPHQPANVFLSTLFGKRTAYLPECGGTVELDVSPNGHGGNQLNLIFRNVRDCSRFDILSNDGQPINYPTKELNGHNGNRSGSFTLPKRAIDFGFNGVKVIMRSVSGKHSDVIHIQFVAF